MTRPNPLRVMLQDAKSRLKASVFFTPTLAISAAIPLVAGALFLVPTLLPPSQAHASDRGLEAKIQAAFPNTHIGSVRCGIVPGLCEVTAGKTVFYTSPDGRYAMVGALLDLKDRVDLTDRRVQELSALEKVTGSIGGSVPTQLAAAASAEPAPASAPGAPPPGSGGLGVIKVDLPAANAIIHHPGAPLKMSVISDLNCGYCKMLFEELKTAPDIQVTEYPVQLLRPDSLDKAKMALCSKDRAAAADSLYFGGTVQTPSDCKSALEAVEANTAFARAHGISGTPTLVRADGRSNAGYMPIDQLRTWLKGAQA